MNGVRVAHSQWSMVPNPRRKQRRPRGSDDAETQQPEKVAVRRRRNRALPSESPEAEPAASGAPRKRTSKKGRAPLDGASRPSAVGSAKRRDSPRRNQRTREPVAEKAPLAPPKARLAERLAGRMVALRGRLRGAGDRAWQRVRKPLLVLGKLIVLAACVVGTVALGRLIERHVRTSPAFAIRSVTFTGQEQLETSELLSASGLAIGQNVFELSPEDVRARLARHPWIASVEVQRRLPGTFSVDVRERRAVAVLALEQLYLVGEDGTVFKQVGADDLVDLPIIAGIARERFVSDRAYRASILLEIVALMHDYRGAGLWRREPIAEVHVEEDDSISLYVGEDSTYVRLGRGPFRDKLQKIRRVFDALDARETRAAYIYADNVRRPDRVTVRLRDDVEAVASQ